MADKQVTGFIFGLIAFFTSITVILGFIFGIIGLVYSIKGVKHGDPEKKGFGIAGIVFSSISIISSFSMLLFIGIVGLVLFTFSTGFDGINVELTNQITEMGIPGYIELTMTDIFYVSDDGTRCSYSSVLDGTCPGVEPFELEGVEYSAPGKFNIKPKFGASYSSNI